MFQLWCLGSSRKIAVAANRRSVDDHIVIIGWSSEGAELEAYNIELSNDAWIPRIELQESGDDNVLLGLAFDFTTTNLQLTDPRDDSGDTKLPPCPVLLCLSLGGKLSLFSVARYVSSLHPKSKETNIAIYFCIECIACPT